MQDSKEAWNKSLYIEFFKMNCTYKYFSPTLPHNDAEQLERATKETSQKDETLPKSLLPEKASTARGGQSKDYTPYSNSLKQFIELILLTNINCEEAYKIVIWGIKKEKAVTWLRSKNPTLLSLLENIKLPKYTSFSVKNWQEWISKTSPSQDLPKLLHAFSIADVVLPQNKEEATQVGKAVERYGAQMTIKNLPAALFGIAHNITLDILSLYLEIQISEEDNLPDVDLMIPFEKSSKSLPGIVVPTTLRLLKLKKKDPLILSIGVMSGSCLRFKDAGGVFLVDAPGGANNGFYVLLEIRNGDHASTPLYNSPGSPNINPNITVVGVGYSWPSRQGDLVIDSWGGKGAPLESEHNLYNGQIEILLRMWSPQLFGGYPSICQLSIGTGGKTPQNYKNMTRIELSQVMLEGKRSSDSSWQVLIGESKKSAEIKNELKTLFGSNFPVNHIIPTKHLEHFTNELIKQHSSIMSWISFSKMCDRFRNALVICQSEGKSCMYSSQNLERIMELQKKESFWTFSKTLIAAFWENLVQFSDFIDLNDDHLIKTISQGKVFNEKIRKLSALIDDKALAVYRTNIIKWTQLVEIDSSDKITFLTSSEAKILYEHSVSFEDLSNFERLHKDRNCIKSLARPDALSALKFGIKFTTLDRIYTLNSSRFDQALKDWIQQDFLMACQFEELASGSKTKDEALDLIRDQEMLQNYDEMVQRYIRFNKNFPSLIKALNSDQVKDLYGCGANFVFLVKLFEGNNQRFESIVQFLTSGQSLKAYELGVNCSSLSTLILKNNSFSQASQDIDQIINEYQKLNLVDEINEFITLYINNQQAFKEITGFLSPETRKLFHELKIRCQDLLRIYLQNSKTFQEAIKILTQNLVEHMKIVNLNSQSLIQLIISRNIEEIKLLFSNNAFHFYQTEWVSLEQLKLITSQEKLKVLLSDRVRSISNFMGFHDLEKIYDKYPEHFETLTSMDCINARYIEISELTNFDEAKIKALTSSDAKMFIEALTSSDGKVRMEVQIAKNALLTLYEEKEDQEKNGFKTLTSPAAIQLYKQGVKFGELKDLWKKNKKNLDNFKQFISHPSVVEAIKVMKPDVPLRKIGKFINEVNHPGTLEKLLSKEILERGTAGDSRMVKFTKY